MAEGSAPRSSELRRSDDYSGPSSFLASFPGHVLCHRCWLGFPASVARSRRTPSVRCTRDRHRAHGSELLARLDESQREAVTSTAQPLAILAGAGSGKTRVLTHRIAWQSHEGAIDPSHVLAVTFTRKAAGELKTRLPRLGVQRSVTAGTFHAIALAQLRRFCEDTGKPVPAILERKVRVLMPLLDERGREAALVAAELASEIEWAKARLVQPDGYERAVAVAGRTPPRPAAQVASVYRAYEREKKKRGVVDFDDLIWQCADAFERDPEFAAAQRWRFRHLFVDEFQDASAAQFRLLHAWLGDRPDLCVVGDGDQAIYGFAGADPDYLVRFTQQFPRERYPDVGVVALGRNYRSTPQVVTAATAVLGPPRPPRHGAGHPARRPRAADHRLRVRRSRGARRRERGARRARRRLPWRRIAVLYRINAQSAAFEEALGRAGVPFRVRGGGRFLERPEVQVALDTLRKTARAAPGRSFSEHLTDLTVDAEMSEERREHTDALVRLGHEYLDAEGGQGSVDGFLAYLNTALRGDDADAQRRRGRAAHVPPRQGTRVRHRVRHRARTRPGTDLARQVHRGARRGATPALRRAEPRRAHVAPELGAHAHHGQSQRQAQPEPVAGAGRARARGGPR